MGRFNSEAGIEKGRKGQYVCSKAGTFPQDSVPAPVQFQEMETIAQRLLFPGMGLDI